MAIKRGDPAAALKAYGSAREYSTSPNHHLEQGLGILEVSSLIGPKCQADNQTCLMFNNTQPLASLIGKIGATVDRAYPPPVRTKTTGDAAAITANDIRQDQERRTQADVIRGAVSTKVSVAEALVALQVQKVYGTAGLAFSKVNKAGLGSWDGQVSLLKPIRLTIGDFIKRCSIISGNLYPSDRVQG